MKMILEPKSEGKILNPTSFNLQISLDFKGIFLTNTIHSEIFLVSEHLSMLIEKRIKKNLDDQIYEVDMFFKIKSKKKIIVGLKHVIEIFQFFGMRMLDHLYTYNLKSYEQFYKLFLINSKKNLIITKQLLKPEKLFIDELQKKMKNHVEVNFDKINCYLSGKSKKFIININFFDLKFEKCPIDNYKKVNMKIEYIDFCLNQDLQKEKIKIILAEEFFLNIEDIGLETNRYLKRKNRII